MNMLTFLAGKKYRVMIDFKSGTWSFLKDEIVQFEKGGYSPYDDCYIYEFLDSEGLRKNWIVAADPPAGLQEKFFLEV